MYDNATKFSKMADKKWKRKRSEYKVGKRAKGASDSEKIQMKKRTREIERANDNIMEQNSESFDECEMKRTVFV